MAEGQPEAGEPLASCERLRDAVDLLGKRWTLLIVALLLQRPARFCALAAALPISDRVLSERLGELIEAGLASRQVDEGPPISSRYALTARGRALTPVIDELTAWSAGAPSG